MTVSPPPAIVEVTRGPFVESRHTIDIVVAAADGSVISVSGNAVTPVYPRSTIKSLQALALVQSGAADAFGYGQVHIALACGSHQAEEMHVRIAGEMLEKAGLAPSCLECGSQLPHREVDRERLARRGRPAEPIHNNCSGKHAGFLAVARHAGIPTEGYIKFSHPVQRMVATNLRQVTGAQHDADNFGIDGCSIPTYAIPLENLALAFAKFAVSKDSDPDRATAMTRIREACFAHPEMVGGTGAFDTDLMRQFGGKVFVKSGAEAVCIACLPGSGLGIALKCRDGSQRASHAAMAATLESLLELDETDSTFLKGFSNPPVNDRRGTRVGEIRMVSGSQV